MKFAKELDRDSVPEWKIKYLNYKAGKKYVKGVSRAISRANATPTLRRATPLPPRQTPSFVASSGNFSVRRTRLARVSTPGDDGEDADPLRSTPAPVARGKAITIPADESRACLGTNPENEFHYGSFVPTPVRRVSSERGAPSFELPGPALDPSSAASIKRHPSGTQGQAVSPAPGSQLQQMPSRRLMQRSATLSASPGPQPPDSGRLRRLLSAGGPLWQRKTQTNRVELGRQSIDEVREAELLFFNFLDSELEKVETFYQMKEQQGEDRLRLLREQLHEMRDRRTEELLAAKKSHDHEGNGNGNGSSAHGANGNGKRILHPGSVIRPLASVLFKPGPNSKSLRNMPHTPVHTGMEDLNRDYVRVPTKHVVPYRTAKRKLKLALQEFYRSLELLKSYALLNRTAFRKLNKKYDKAVNARPPLKYMTEKVNKSWFVNSDILDAQIHAVEDLYARYFEKGNTKLAVGKLRALSSRPGEQSGTTFLNGLLIGTGLMLSILGVANGAQLLFHSDETVRTQTSYLLQIYGGYFLMLYLFTMFCINCRIWTVSKINYPFIFEFDPRSHIDWRQLSTFPSFFLLLFGICIWLNFRLLVEAPSMYLYYPVVLVFLTVFIMFLPAPVLYYRSRLWLIYSHWRLLLSGLYPVEFRDFFLGDMYCSLVYATANLELFFCLYANQWNNPVQCNSNHSRLLGFFAAMPAVWRALQCLRRYRDTRNIFPHLVNLGKYTMTILAAVFLSLYRISGSHANLSLFIFFASINGVYCSVWDLFMDFSLVQAGSRQRFLRDVLGFKNKWPYYTIMVIDPILRFSWIFYAIFTHNSQHSTIVSFLVALAEVTRRGMWSVFRVENEHCANVAMYRASREVPLPYKIKHLSESAPPSAEEGEQEADYFHPDAPESAATGAEASRVPTVRSEHTAQGQTVAAEEEGTAAARVSSFGKAATAAGKKSIVAIMAEAHKQDFEKRRKPEVEPLDEDAEGPGECSDEDDEEDETHSLLEDRIHVRDVLRTERADGGT